MINTIELFPDGRIGAYEMPVPIEDGFVSDYLEALEAAKRDAVYFKEGYQDESFLISVLPYPMQAGKQYPVPDGYEVKTEKEPDKFEMTINGPICVWEGKVYAILVPKDNGYLSECICTGVCLQVANAKCKAIVPKEKAKVDQITLAWFKLQNMMSRARPKGQKQHLIDMMKEDEKNGMYELPKQQSIEEAARELNPKIRGSEYDAYKIGFIAGAKWMEALAQAYGDYREREKGAVALMTFNKWYEQFKQEKL